jgi:hypothetical protein
MPTEPVSLILGRRSKIRQLTVTVGDDGGEKPPVASEHDGAMAGARDTSLPGIIQQIESTGRKSRTRRAHLGQNRSRGQDKEVARLGEAVARAPARGDRSLGLDNSFERMRWMRRGVAPGLYSPGAVPRKEGGDWVTNLVGSGFGKHCPDGVRRKALLTHGPVMSAKRREERGSSRSRAPLGLRWLARLGPRERGRGEGANAWAGSAMGGGRGRAQAGPTLGQNT